MTIITDQQVNFHSLCFLQLKNNHFISATSARYDYHKYTNSFALIDLCYFYGL